jgi:hypothetical protein
MALADLLVVGTCGEPLGGVLADRLEHRQARLAVCRRPGQHALRDEAVDDVEAGVGDMARGVDGAAAGERGQLCERRSLGFIEQLIAPVQGGPQRPLTLRRVARARRKRGQDPVERADDLQR